METSGSSLENNIVPRNSQEVYLKLLGIRNLPEDYRQMPPEIILPAGVLGDLEKAILLTRGDGKERSQSIDWDSRRNEYAKGPLLLGHEDRSGRLNMARLRFGAYFGHKKLISYHTHPYDAYDTASDEDIAEFSSTPRVAFIYIVGSDGGITAYCQTKKAAKLPVEEHFRYFNVLRKKRYEGLHVVDLYEEKEFGLVTYSWSVADSGFDRRFIQQGDLSQGVKLRAVFAAK